MSRLHGGYQQSGEIRAEAASPKMALIYSYIHEHTCTYKTPPWIYKNPKDVHRLVFISTWTEKTQMLPCLVHGRWKTSAFFCNFLKYFQHVLAQLSYAHRELRKYRRLMELLGRAVARLCPGQQTEEHFQHTLKIQILSKSLESRCQLWITWLLCHIFPGYAHWLR